MCRGWEPKMNWFEHLLVILGFTGYQAQDFVIAGVLLVFIAWIPLIIYIGIKCWIDHPNPVYLSPIWGMVSLATPLMAAGCLLTLISSMNTEQTAPLQIQQTYTLNGRVEIKMINGIAVRDRPIGEPDNWSEWRH